MKIFSFIYIFISISISSQAQNKFNVSEETFTKNVKVRIQNDKVFLHGSDCTVLQNEVNAINQWSNQLGQETPFNIQKL